MSFDFTLAIPLWVLIVLALTHWVADFVCQTQHMADFKAHYIATLIWHVTAYSTVMLVAGLIVMPDPRSVVCWSLVNFGLHFVIDFVTSRASAHEFREGEKHNGWVIIGFDQFLHLACLALTTVMIAQ